MFPLGRAMLCLSLLAGLAAPALGADAESKAAAKQAKEAKKRSPFRVPKEITLTSEQQTQLEVIQNELSPKANELLAKLDGILTAEQKTARAEAAKAAKAAGKKGPEARAALDAAVQLSEEQKKLLAETQAAVKQNQREFRTKLEGILNADQKEQLKRKKKDKPAAPAAAATP